MTAIPLDGGAVDAVVCYSSSSQFQGKPQALVEVFRVTSWGGRSFIAHSPNRVRINHCHRHTAEVRRDMISEDGDISAILTAARCTDVFTEDLQDGHLALVQKPG